MPDKTIAEKLDINPNQSLTLFNPPENKEGLTESLTEDISISEGDPADVLLAFIDNQNQFNRSLLALKSNITENGNLWILWQKNEPKTSLDQPYIINYAHKKGLQEIKETNLNDEWTALKLKITD
jgi:hypothetical protein